MIAAVIRLQNDLVRNMSEFFNSVVIRDGAAIAYEDRHVPGDAFFWILDGPLKAFNNIGYGSHIETEFLCDTAESGYLIDFDENTLIYFGDPWPSGDKLDEKRAGAIAAFEMGYENFLTHISDCWPSWKLIWDKSRVDAFGRYLNERGFTNICAGSATRTKQEKPIAIFESHTKNGG